MLTQPWVNGGYGETERYQKGLGLVLKTSCRNHAFLPKTNGTDTTDTFLRGTPANKETIETVAEERIRL
jgi:hypothetical protein